MVTTHDDDSLRQLLAEVALSAARVRRMADEAHALVEMLEHRPVPSLVKQWSAGVQSHPSPTHPKKKG